MADNFDNYGMKVRATVDLPSVGDIDKQIRKLEKSISKLQVSGKLDDASLKALSHQLDTLKATVTTANFSSTALTELTNQVNRALENVRIDNINIGNVNNQAQQVGQQIGQQINEGIKQNVNVDDVIEKAYSKYLSLTGKKSSAIFKGQLNEISPILQNDIDLLEKFSSSIDGFNDASELRDTVNNFANIKTEIESVITATNTLNDSANRSFDIDTTTAQQEVKELITITDNYGRELDEIHSKLLSTSKMMNTQGKLITLFHGSPNEFDSFKINDRGRFEDTLGVGGYFYDNPSDSIGYGNVSQWFANVEKIFDTSAKLSTEEIQSLYDKYKVQIKEILDIDNLFDFSSSVNKSPIDSLKSLSTQMGFDSSHLMRELGYDAIIDRGATSTYVILDEKKIIKANSALKEQVSLITDVQEAKKMEENADPQRNWNQSVMDAMKAKRESFKQEASLSDELANTVVQNEEKKQQAIDETADKVEEEIQRSERLAKAQSRLKDSYDQISKNYDVKSITFDNTIDADKDAHDYFQKILKDEEAVIYTTSKLGELGGLKEFTTHIKRASGELESLRFILDDDPESDNGRFRFAESVINDKGHLQQVEQIEKTYTNYLNKLNDLKTKYSEASVDYSGFESVLKNFRQGTVDVNALKVAFNELSNSAKLGVQSLKSQDSSFDPIQQALNNMRDMPSMLKTLEASMSGVKDKTSLAGISVKDLTSKYEALQKEMTDNGGKVPLTEKWTSDYRELMSAVTSATKQVDALKKAEASDNSQTQKQANYYSTILSNYREIYSLKQKLLTAGKEETKVIQEQIRSLNYSNASINKQLGKQGLKDSNWQTQVDDLKEELDYSLRISEARQKDKANQSSLNNAQREAIQIVEELEQAYQRVQDIKIKIASLDKAKDGEKISTLSQEEESAQAEYKQLYERLRKRKNYDKESWNETKSAIDSATKSQIEYNNAASQDTLNKVQKAEIANFRILKDKWDKQGLLVDEFRAKVEAMESSLSSVGSKGELDNLKIDIKDLKTEATQLLEANKAYKKAEKELTATLEKRRAAQANSAKEKAKSNTQQELAQQREVNAILSKQESAYKEIWNINKQIANLDTTEDADVIGALNEKKKFYQDIYLSAQKELQAYNNIVVSHEHLASLAEIRKKAESEIGVTVAKQNKALAEEADRIQLSFDDGTYEAKYDSLIAKTRQWINANDESVISTQRLNTAYNEFNQAATAYAKDGSVANRDKLIQKEEELARQIKATTNEVKSYNAEYAKSSKVDSLHQKIQEFYDKNTATHRKWGAQLKNMLNETAHGAQLTATRVNEIEQEFLGVGNAARQAGKLGLSFFDSIKEQAKKFTQWASLSGLIMQVANRVRTANTELKEMNSILTEISKTNDSLSKTDLAQIGDNAFEKASKYGKTATDYLTGVQEMSRAGYDNAEEMAELTTAVQGAGDMTAELANSYVIATDKAYQMNGSVQALTKTLDGANNITNNNAVNMTELAEGMSVVGSQAASSQMSVEQTTAAIGTLVAVTQQGGSEMGNAFKGILMNLQQVTGEIDGEEIDTESLTKYEKACAELGVSLSEVKDGVVSLKEPMQILKELSVEYQKLDDSDAKRANLLSAVGGKYLPRYIEIYN